MSSIIDLVTGAITPAIQAPYELVDVEYGKMGGDYVLSIFVDKEGGFLFKIRQICQKSLVQFWIRLSRTHFRSSICWK